MGGSGLSRGSRMGLMDFCHLRGSFCAACLYRLFPIPPVPGSCRASHDPRALDVQSTSASGSPAAMLTLPVLSIASPPPPSVQSGARISIRLRSGMRDSSFNAVQLSNFAGARSEPRIQLVPESPMWPAVRTCGPRLCKAPWPHFSTSGVRTPSCK